MIEENTLREILRSWRIEMKTVRPDIQISGSPDRCLSRMVIEDAHGRLFILEKLDEKSRKRKTVIQKNLMFLAEKKTAGIIPYLMNILGEAMFREGGFLWQVIQYTAGIPLRRPDYIHEGWRGRASADFLLDFKNKSAGLQEADAAGPFSLSQFITGLMEKLAADRPALLKRVQPALDYLDTGLMSSHDQLPVRFCHGDYHPLNIIWSQDNIRAVIDWEFCGNKPEPYDAANMVGCIGMERPDGLQGEFAYAFMDRLVEMDYFHPMSRRFFFDFVLALRFAWLSEWLHVHDQEMVDLEAVYINLLLDNRGVLSRSWRCPVRG